MIKKLLSGLICICSFMLQSSCFASLMDYPNIAVLNFSKKAAVSQDLTFDDASMVTDYVIDALLDTDMFNVIEREQLRAITDEHSFNASGLIDMSTATQLGKMHGVKYLVYGSVVGLSLKDTGIDYSNDKYGKIGNTKHTVIADVTARFIDVETGRIVLTGRGEGESSSTQTELGLKKRKRTSNEDAYSEDGDVNKSEEGATNNESDYEQTFKIGAVAVSQKQVHNALAKAADDLVFGKFGFLEKIERKGKRRK